MTDTNDIDMPATGGFLSKIGRVLLLILLGIAAIFALGFVVGVSGAAIEHGHLSLKATGLLAGGLAACALCAYLVYRLRPDMRFGEPMSPKTRRANWALIASGVLGGVIGLVLALTELQTGEGGVFSNGPIPLGPALFVVGAYVLLLPLLAYHWFRNADEFERAASGKGAVAAIYAYGFIAPTWWILTRAGLLPPQDPMIVYLIVISVWGVVWQIRRAD